MYVRTKYGQVGTAKYSSAAHERTLKSFLFFTTKPPLDNSSWGRVPLLFLKAHITPSLGKLSALVLKKDKKGT